MRNDSNFGQFIMGYSYKIIKRSDQINDLELYRGITSSFEETIKINTYSPVKYKEGNFTIHFLVESVYRGLLEVNESINFITDPNSRIFFSMEKLSNLISAPSFLVNRTETIRLVIENIGGANAFFISASIQEIEPPVGLNQFQFPISIELLEASQTVQIEFEIKPERAGIGHLEIKTEYKNSNNKTSSGLIKLNVDVLPRVDASLTIDDEIINGVQTEINAFISNQEQESIIISETISSNKILFTNNPLEQKALDTNLELSYFGSIISFGNSFIFYTIHFYDPDGSGSAIIHEAIYPISIKDGTIVIEDNNFSFVVILIIISALLLIIILFFGLIAFLKYVPSVNKAFFDKLSTHNINSRFNYKGKKIIVDGANVAWENPKDGKNADLANIEIAKKALEDSGFESIQFIVDASLRYKVGNVSNFDKFAKNKFFKVIPAKVEADLFILRLSEETGALILSNDLFREFREEFKWIEKRRIPFSIINDKFFLHPNEKKQT